MNEDLSVKMAQQQDDSSSSVAAAAAAVKISLRGWYQNIYTITTANERTPAHGSNPFSSFLIALQIQPSRL